jgi:hypothetical protein
MEVQFVYICLCLEVEGDRMNKLEVFYELQKASLPSVQWNKYDINSVLDEKILWTIRTVIIKGDDLNLPRRVGVKANEAKQFANELLYTLGKNYLVLFYPYVIEEKSGLMKIFHNRVIIEAVQYGLWNLSRHKDRDVTISISGSDTIFEGKKDFLSNEETDILLGYSESVKKIFSTQITEGKELYLEWSFSHNSDINKKPVGDKNLIFYEIRSFKV